MTGQIKHVEPNQTDIQAHSSSYDNANVATKQSAQRRARAPPITEFVKMLIFDLN